MSKREERIAHLVGDLQTEHALPMDEIIRGIAWWYRPKEGDRGDWIEHTKAIRRKLIEAANLIDGREEESCLSS